MTGTTKRKHRRNAQLSRARKRARLEYKDVDFIIVDVRAGRRNNIVGVCRDGRWRFPRLESGQSALMPRPKLPRVRMS